MKKHFAVALDFQQSVFFGGGWKGGGVLSNKQENSAHSVGHAELPLV